MDKHNNSELLLSLRISLKNFLDEDGRMVQWPSKPKFKLFAILYLACMFEKGRKYTESEVNSLLKQWHTFKDWALLRRELFERGYIDRTLDGREYCLTDKEINLK